MPDDLKPPDCAGFLGMRWKFRLICNGEALQWIRVIVETRFDFTRGTYMYKKMYKKMTKTMSRRSIGQIRLYHDFTGGVIMLCYLFHF